MRLSMLCSLLLATTASALSAGRLRHRKHQRTWLTSPEEDAAAFTCYAKDYENTESSFDCGEEGMIDDFGNLIAHTRSEDWLAYKIYQGMLQDCVAGETTLPNILLGWASAPACYEAADSTSKRVPAEHMAKQDGWMVDKKDDSGEVIKVDGKKKLQQRLCEDETLKTFPGKFDGEFDLDYGYFQVQNSRMILKNLVDEWSAWLNAVTLRAEDATEKAKALHHLRLTCRRMFSMTSEDPAKVYALMDNVRCPGYEDPKGFCVTAEEWAKAFFSKSMFGGKKGRSYGGEETPLVKKMKKCRKDMQKLMKERGLLEGGRNDHTVTAGITTEYPQCNDFELRGKPYTLGFQFLKDASKKMERPKAEPIYLDTHSAGKYLHYQDSTLPQTKHFITSKAPFVAGVSGTIAGYLRVLTRTNPKEAGPVDDKTALVLMAVTVLGGHHSMTEVTVAAKDYFKFMQGTNHADENGRFLAIPAPFDATGAYFDETGTSIDDNSAAEKSPITYKRMIEGLTALVHEKWPDTKALTQPEAPIYYGRGSLDRTVVNGAVKAFQAPLLQKAAAKLNKAVAKKKKADAVTYADVVRGRKA